MEGCFGFEVSPRFGGLEHLLDCPGSHGLDQLGCTLMAPIRMNTMLNNEFHKLVSDGLGSSESQGLLNEGLGSLMILEMDMKKRPPLASLVLGPWDFDFFIQEHGENPSYGLKSTISNECMRHLGATKHIWMVLDCCWQGLLKHADLCMGCPNLNAGLRNPNQDWKPMITVLPGHGFFRWVNIWTCCFDGLQKSVGKHSCGIWRVRKFEESKNCRRCCSFYTMCK